MSFFFQLVFLRMFLIFFQTWQWSLWWWWEFPTVPGLWQRHGRENSCVCRGWPLLFLLRTGEKVTINPPFLNFFFASSSTSVSNIRHRCRPSLSVLRFCVSPRGSLKHYFFFLNYYLGFRRVRVLNLLTHWEAEIKIWKDANSQENNNVKLQIRLKK